MEKSEYYTSLSAAIMAVSISVAGLVFASSTIETGRNHKIKSTKTTAHEVATSVLRLTDETDSADTLYGHPLPHIPPGLATDSAKFQELLKQRKRAALQAISDHIGRMAQQRQGED